MGIPILGLLNAGRPLGPMGLQTFLSATVVIPENEGNLQQRVGQSRKHGDGHDKDKSNDGRNGTHYDRDSRKLLRGSRVFKVRDKR